ncbi:MAG TPA: ABC transporter permease [Bryobacteraceae bacterium]|jgi:predicted permease|nr:ABC transporter permease [Bryobacteraceae bacterium]
MLNPNWFLRIYRRLARAFPHEFQMVYGADVVQLGEDAIEEIAKAHGILGLVSLVADLAWRVPLEYLSEIRQDLVYAVRMLLKSPSLAVAAVLSLGLGIGVPTAGFSEINAFLLRDLPGAKDPKRLLTTEQNTSYLQFERYRDHRELFSGVTAYVGSVPFKFENERVFGQLVSPEYFDVIGVNARADGVVVSDRFWRERLNAAPDTVGRSVRINGRLVTIAGVAPKDFLGTQPVMPADLFVPISMRKDFAPELRDESKSFSVLMRLQPGVTEKSANAAAETITRQLDAEGLDADRNRKGQRAKLIPGGGTIPRSREMLPVIFAFMGTLMALILGIACTNLANMLLARGAGRRKEIAIRLAVGASRFRLIRQLLTESVLLALAGGVAGFAFAYWLLSGATSMYKKFPMPVPIELDVRPDWTVLWFNLALALIAGIGFGLAPALAATKADVGPALKEGSSTQLRGYRRFGLRNLLMVYQVAGSLMVLIITGFIVLGFSAIKDANARFDTSNLYLMAIDPVRDGYSPAQTGALFQKLRDRLQGLPAVENAAFADEPPANVFAMGTTTITVPAGGGAAAKTVTSVKREIIGANYFATLRLTVAGGREFSARDEGGTGAAQPVILSEIAAEQMFGTTNPIGRRIVWENQAFDVAGVVPDLSGRVFGVKPPPTIFTPLSNRAYSRPPAGGMTLMVRAGAGSDAMNEIRHEIAAIDPNLSVFNARTMVEFLDQANALTRWTSFVYGGFGVFGLILASVGLAGVTAYSVAQRRKEIGIRMALGARQGQMLRLVMKEGAMLVTVGSALGFLGAWGVGRALSAVSPEMADTLSAKQPLLMIGAPLLLGGLAMLACYFPARKSTSVDPLVALRME